MRARGVEAHEARWLEVTENSACIELQQRVFDDVDRLFSFSKLLWRGELAEFTARTVVTRDELATRNFST